MTSTRWTYDGVPVELKHAGDWCELLKVPDVLDYGSFNNGKFRGRPVKIHSITLKATKMWMRAALLKYDDMSLDDWSRGSSRGMMALTTDHCLCIDGQVKKGAEVRMVLDPSRTDDDLVEPLILSNSLVTIQQQFMSFRGEQVTVSEVNSIEMEPICLPLIQDEIRGEPINLTIYGPVDKSVVIGEGDDGFIEERQPLVQKKMFYSTLTEKGDKTKSSTYENPIVFRDLNASTFEVRIKWLESMYKMLKLRGYMFEHIVGIGDGLGVVAMASNPWGSKVHSSDKYSVQANVKRQPAIPALLDALKLGHSVLFVAMQVTTHIPYLIHYAIKCSLATVLVYDTSANFEGRQHLREVSPCVYIDSMKFSTMYAPPKQRERRLAWTEKLILMDHIKYMNPRFYDYLPYLFHMRPNQTRQDMTKQCSLNQVNDVVICFTSEEVYMAKQLGYVSFDMRVGMYTHQVEYFAVPDESTPLLLTHGGVLLLPYEVEPLSNAYVEKCGDTYCVMPAVKHDYISTIKIIVVRTGEECEIRLSSKTMVRLGESVFTISSTEFPDIDVFKGFSLCEWRMNHSTAGYKMQDDVLVPWGIPAVVLELPKPWKGVFEYFFLKTVRSLFMAIVMFRCVLGRPTKLGTGIDLINERRGWDLDLKTQGITFVEFQQFSDILGKNGPVVDINESQYLEDQYVITPTYEIYSGPNPRGILHVDITVSTECPLLMMTHIEKTTQQKASVLNAADQAPSSGFADRMNMHIAIQAAPSPVPTKFSDLD